jgi:hypothetical protein
MAAGGLDRDAEAFGADAHIATIERRNHVGGAVDRGVDNHVIIRVRRDRAPALIERHGNAQ